MEPHAKWVANARMYAVNAGVSALWERLFAWLARATGMPLTVVAHAAPLPLPRLWMRSDLGCAFMCGYPWSTWNDGRHERPALVAAPVPSPARYDAMPVYCTDVVVRDDAPFASLDDLRGARFGYTESHSQSGYQAPRAMIAARALHSGGRWFGDIVGPLQTPRAVVDAVVDGRIDAGPLDSYWHDLLRLHEPTTAARLRTIACTPMTAIPPLVASAALNASLRARLSAALKDLATQRALDDVRNGLLLRGFACVRAEDYAPLLASTNAADELGYRVLR
jgi:ABC-type phosphate/phosphonate transport system substrate-binding protein